MKITVIAVEQSFDKALKSFVQVTSEQLSVAVAPPLDANHASIAPSLPVPSHSTTILVIE
ncbi:hypothetical protein H9X57_05250 [Flavobacterium piscinae]|uniref:hypothetical protein n=1 Tax=Flavobacterium piscinae TaxID=2506424 RepID=UPI0019C32147|nr:hypothetical protein [Flavobacterium piscinae]MBC8883015.1 hypothetical protein [Flavobacterium piscinae]